MIYLRLLAPVVIDYAAVPGAANRDPEAYGRLWQRLVPRLQRIAVVGSGAVSVTTHHTTAPRTVHRYATIDVDSLERSLHFLTVQADPRALPVSAGTGPGLRVADVSLHCYDHGIALLEIGIEPDNPPAGSHPERWLDELQARGIEIANQYGDLLHTEVLEPLFAHARALDSKQEFIGPAFDVDDPHHVEGGQTMWVSRSLVVPPTLRHLLMHWTKDVVDTSNATLREELIDGSSDRLVRWLNYAFVDVDRVGGRESLLTGRFRDHWQGLRYAQLTYAALDQVDTRLGLVLADAAAAHQRWQLELLRNRLVELSSRAEVIMLERQHLAKYMKRAVRAHVEEILEIWDYRTLLEEPVTFKTQACARRLDELASKRNARSSVITDLILLGIGVTSIAATAIAIIEFGRSSAADPNSTGYDLGGSGFTNWFAAQPVDAVLLISGVISVLIVALYLYFRRDDQA